MGNELKIQEESQAHMRIIAIAVLVFVQIAREKLSSGLPALVNEISKICDNRWKISVGDGNHILLDSKDRVFGRLLEQCTSRG